MKKGFTVVELLAVIIIISIIVTFTGVSVSKLVKKSKKQLTEIQSLEIINASKNYISSNMNLNISSGECKYITLSKLKENGYIEDIDSNDVYVKIELDNDSVLLNYKYEIASSVDGCSELN